MHIPHSLQLDQSRQSNGYLPDKRFGNLPVTVAPNGMTKPSLSAVNDSERFPGGVNQLQIITSAGVSNRRAVRARSPIGTDYFRVRSATEFRAISCGE